MTKSFVRSLSVVVVAAALLTAVCAEAGTPVSPFDSNGQTKIDTTHRSIDRSKDLGDPVNFAAALAAGADYLRHAQADITEDNAANDPEVDPDDGGWDFLLTAPNYTHTASASSLNIYGATVQGAYRAYLQTPSASLLATLADAANGIMNNPSIHSGPDLVFLINYSALVSGPTYAATAKARYDARIAFYGDAASLAASIRDARAGQGYANGIIPWDVAPWVVTAQLLDGLYSGLGYDAQADAMAEVLYQDSYLVNPGDFDIDTDNGWDPTYTDTNFYWYNLGISGLIDSFRASNTHTSEIPDLVARILASQTSEGAICGSYGVHANDEDWQSTAYATLSLAALDQATYQMDINRMAYFLAATQDAVHGSWTFSDDTHITEIGGECTAAVSFGMHSDDVIVDVSFTSQSAVDAYNTTHGTHYIWGYDAFADIQSGIDNVSGSTVNVLAGTYVGAFTLPAHLTLYAPAGPTLTTITGNSDVVLTVAGDDVTIDGFTITNPGGHHAILCANQSGLAVLNNHVTDVGSAASLDNTHAVSVSSTTAAVTDISIQNNQIDAIRGQLGHKSVSAIAIGFTGVAINIDGVVIQGNTIDDIVSNEPNPADGWGAYGIIVNHTSTLNLQILDNTITNIEGLWAHGIGLEGDTPGAMVTGNTISDLIDHKVTPDAVGVQVEDNPGLASVHINNNSFDNMSLGVTNVVGGPNSVDASCNWWGSVGGPDVPGNPNPGAPSTTSFVTFMPWLDGYPMGACSLTVGTIDATGPAACLTNANPCGQVAVNFDRGGAITNVRGVSVTFQLSAELELCAPATPASNIHIASFWGAYPLNTQVLDNGSGSYTVDTAVLGSPCGPVASGDLFMIDVTPSGMGAETTGMVTITSVTVRDCANAPLPGVAGGAATVSIDQIEPDPVTSLTATQKKTGNDTDGTTQINLGWAASGSMDVNHVEIWRKGFGHYPEYDDNGGAVPTGPITIGNGWALAAFFPGNATVVYTDEPSSRDYWYYAVLVFDDCGSVSTATMTTGTLNYHLGDVRPGSTGDNHVDTADISRLGNHYGETLGTPTDPSGDIDVGPTTDMSVDGRPTTDNYIGFEDLIMFAINYGVVSRQVPQHPLGNGGNAVAVKVDPATNGTIEAQITMQGNGAIQGLSVPLVWNADVVEPVGFTEGSIISDQGGLGMVLSPRPGMIDAAIFGVRDRGIDGEGALATVTFRMIGTGDPRIALGEITARDAGNKPVQISGELAAPSTPLPDQTTLYANTPNPFNPATKLAFALSRPGAVSLRIYGIDGRLVRTVVAGDLAVGRHEYMWYGDDDGGRTVASGTYVVRLEAPDRSQMQRITLVK